MVSANDIEVGFQDFCLGSISFDEFAIRLFNFQARENTIYREYLSLINRDAQKILSTEQIPFLPINFFKNHKIVTTDYVEEKVFSSSSTTGQIPSKHYIRSLAHYTENTVRLFEKKLGRISDKIVIGLLPSYLERNDSSLVCMVDHFVKLTSNELSGFHLYDLDQLHRVLESASQSREEVILFAVRYALLELAEQYELDLSHVTIIETGGMKGKRGPVSNEELKNIVVQKLKPRSLISEYGMTELLSQAYSDDDFLFTTPDSMQVFITELNDPFCHMKEGRTGQINIIDLANLYSCAFIATDDLGVKYGEDKFRVLGRMDNSEQRGCNLLVADVIT